VGLEADRAEWLQRIERIRTWRRAGERAPHKPLLLLYLLGRLQRDGTSEVSYEAAERPLLDLLAEFGPPRATSPAYPFHHLTTDGFWEVTSAEGGSPGASPGRLRATHAVGRLAPQLEAALRADPGLVALTVHGLLDRSFPPSLHAELCAAVGLDLEALEGRAVRGRVATLRRRDPAFRDAVLMAYEQRCAVCGYDGRIGSVAIGLDAAHVRWWAFEGPDSIENALCLCAIHHRLFDKGALGVAADGTVAISARFVGGDAARQLVLAFAGKPLAVPQPGLPAPAAVHVAWHASEVFRGPARLSA
jgi:putative restriction endonuclease